MSASRNRSFWIGLFVVALLAGAVVVGALVFSGNAPAASQSTSQVTVSPVSAASSMAALGSLAAVGLPKELVAGAQQLNQTDGAAVQSALLPGNVDSAHASELLSGVGSMKLDIYAATTDKSQVCIFDSSGLSGCVDTFNQQAPVVFLSRTPTSAGPTADGYLEGLAPDRVVKVELLTGGAVQDGIFKNNAFFFELHGPPTSLIVTYNDGSTQTIPAY